MPMTQDQYLDLLNKSIKKVFFKEYDRYENEWQQFCTKETTKRRDETFSELTGFGMIPVLTEGSKMTEDRAYQGYDVTITPRVRARMTSVTKLMYMNAEHVKIQQMVEDMAEKFQYTKDYNFAVIFNSGFTTTYYAGGDGKALFADDHPRSIGLGGTWPNEPATGSVLSETSLRAAIKAMEAQLDDRGLKIKLKPEALVYHPDNEWIAREILQSEKTPNSGNNAINPLKNRVKPVQYNFLTSSAPWFLTSNKSKKRMLYLERWPINREKDSDIDTMNLIFTADECYEFGFTDNGRSLYGNPGS